MRIVDRAKARIGRIKADRSTEMGVAGHQAVTKALGKAAGWKSIDIDEVTHNGMHYSGFRTAYPDPDKNSLDDVNKKMFTPGKAPSDKGQRGNKVTIKPGVIDRHKPTEDF